MNSFDEVCGGNVVNSLPSVVIWSCVKGARSEPAEMGVPFSDHSPILAGLTRTFIRALFICGKFLCLSVLFFLFNN